MILPMEKTFSWAVYPFLENEGRDEAEKRRNCYIV